MKSSERKHEIKSIETRSSAIRDDAVNIHIGFMAEEVSATLKATKRVSQEDEAAAPAAAASEETLPLSRPPLIRMFTRSFIPSEDGSVLIISRGDLHAELFEQDLRCLGIERDKFFPVSTRDFEVAEKKEPPKDEKAGLEAKKASELNIKNASELSQAVIRALKSDFEKASFQQLIDPKTKIKMKDKLVTEGGLPIISAAQIGTGPVKDIFIQFPEMGMQSDASPIFAAAVLKSIAKAGAIKDKQGVARPARLISFGAGGSVNPKFGPGKITEANSAFSVRVYKDPSNQIDAIIGNLDKLKKQRQGDDKIMKEIAAYEEEIMRIRANFGYDDEKHHHHDSSIYYNPVETQSRIREISKFLAENGRPILLTKEDKYIGEISVNTPTGRKVLFRSAKLEDRFMAQEVACQIFLKLGDIDQPQFSAAFTSGCLETRFRGYKAVNELKTNFFPGLFTKIDYAMSSLREEYKSLIDFDSLEKDEEKIRHETPVTPRNAPGAHDRKSKFNAVNSYIQTVHALKNELEADRIKIEDLKKQLGDKPDSSELQGQLKTLVEGLTVKNEKLLQAVKKAFVQLIIAQRKYKADYNECAETIAQYQQQVMNLLEQEMREGYWAQDGQLKRIHLKLHSEEKAGTKVKTTKEVRDTGYFEILSPKHGEEPRPLVSLDHRISEMKAEVIKSFDDKNVKGITLSGSLFFSEQMKKAVNQMLAGNVAEQSKLTDCNTEDDIVFNLIEYMSKPDQKEIPLGKLETEVKRVNVDPFDMTTTLINELKEWAKNVKFKTDDYVDAIMWQIGGFNVDQLPDSGNWTPIRDSEKKTPVQQQEGHEPLTLQQEFELACVKTKDSKIVNPFFREIATDLLADIKSGAAYNSEFFANKQDELKIIQKRHMGLINQIKAIIKGQFLPGSKEEHNLRELIKNLVTDFLEVNGWKKKDQDVCDVWIRQGSWGGFQVQSLDKLELVSSNADRSFYVSGNFTALVQQAIQEERQRAIQAKKDRKDVGKVSAPVVAGERQAVSPAPAVSAPKTSVNAIDQSSTVVQERKQGRPFFRRPQSSIPSSAAILNTKKPGKAGGK